MSHKDLSSVAQHLHPEVGFTAPLAKVKGKEAFMSSIKGFMGAPSRVFLSEPHVAQDSQAMLAYDVDFGDPIVDW